MDTQSFNELLVYTTAAVSAGVAGYAVETFNEFSLSIAQTSTLLNTQTILAGLQMLANQALFGLNGSVQGFAPALFTPFETNRALDPFAGNCSFDLLDPTGQSNTFSSVPPVSFVSNSSQPLSPPFVIPINTKLNIDTTQLRDSDNCKSDAPSLSCQVMALQDISSFQTVSVAVFPLNECQVSIPGTNNIYVTSDDTPLPTDLAGRVSMPIDTICAGSTYVYVYESIGPELEL
ncbi:hypothetical protein Clacol_008675 [Clathrus columnatus]|uniref:Uncharacterized protein n=1 Tax=Clathrus columnatus TaxID=1419009 RepID=A0AAV5ANE4_9AGAM|nr:hypothetical protein Clacol_008675 [Clathrus columnatus]